MKKEKKNVEKRNVRNRRKRITAAMRCVCATSHSQVKWYAPKNCCDFVLSSLFSSSGCGNTR